MTNLDDPNRGSLTGARKTRAWPTTDPTKTCSDHPLDRQTRPPSTPVLSFWYKLEPSHVLVAGHLYPSLFQHPESYPVLSYHDQSTDSIAAVLLYCGYRIVCGKQCRTLRCGSVHLLADTV